jgi:hypothetical protein
LNKTYRSLIEEKKLIIVSPIGKSMLPLIREGKDSVRIDVINRKIKKFDVVLYQKKTGEYMLHRIIGRNQQGFILCGDNQWKMEFGVQEDDIIGIMTAVYRQEKEIPISNFGYRLYSKIRVYLRPFRGLLHRINNKIRRRNS